jgi:hypothetical protein
MYLLLSSEKASCMCRIPSFWRVRLTVSRWEESEARLGPGTGMLGIEWIEEVDRVSVSWQ